MYLFYGAKTRSYFCFFLCCWFRNKMVFLNVIISSGFYLLYYNTEYTADLINRIYTSTSTSTSTQGTGDSYVYRQVRKCLSRISSRNLSRGRLGRLPIWAACSVTHPPSRAIYPRGRLGRLPIWYEWHVAMDDFWTIFDCKIRTYLQIVEIFILFKLLLFCSNC